MRAAHLIVEELVFYFGRLSPRQFFCARLVCKRWAALLTQDRFWRRQLDQLPQSISPLLGPLPRLRIYEWYAKLGHRIRTYFEGTLERERDQCLWNAMLLAGMTPAPATPTTLTALGKQCLTRVERSCVVVVVALASRNWQRYEIELRKETQNARKRRRRQHSSSADDDDDDKTLVLHLWYGESAKEVRLLPHILSDRLAALVFDPANAQRQYKRNII